MFDLPIFAQMPFAGEELLSIALMLLGGFLLTRVTKRLKLPDVTGYIVAGMLIGPYGLRLIPRTIVEGTDFLSDIALAFIAFGTGEFFQFSAWKRNGGKVVVITALEAVMASAVVFAVCYWLLGVDLAFSAVLAALASATSPASTLMTIRQLGAHGEFVNTLLQVVALDDVVALLEYSTAISIALWAKGDVGRSGAGSVLIPVAVNLAVIVVSFFFGWLMKALLSKRSTDNRLIIAVALLFSFCGLCTLFQTSPLLGCMSMGMVYRNLARDDKLFKQLNYFNPPILLLFFVRSGANFQLDSFFSFSAMIGATTLLVVSVFYFFLRLAGKYAGAFLGCLAVGKPRNVRNYLGLALAPQAGVSIGLAAMGARTLTGPPGEALQTIILASSVLYELIGPGCAKLSLCLSGSCGRDEPNGVEHPDPLKFWEEQSSADILARRIRQIEKELPKHPEPVSVEEKAFLEAAEEQLTAIHQQHQVRRPRNRRF